MIPINSGRRSLGAVHYAIRQSATGHRLEVCLLHVDRVLGDGEPLPTEGGSADKARLQLDDVLARIARPLVDHDVPYAGYLRSGSIVFEIVDAAEELDCQEIVVPAPRSGWRRLCSPVVPTLYARQRDIPVVTVDANGLPVRSVVMGA